VNVSVLVLLFVTVVWGTTFPIIRAASAHLSGVEISALRFLVAGACMLPFTVNASRKAWRDGALLGTIALLSYVTQAVGLQYISSNRSAFITSLNVLMVPFLGLFLGRRLNFQIVGAAVLACTGIGLMSWDSGSNLIGDSATFGCALFYAIYVILLSRRIGAHRTRTLAATQNVTMAVIGGVWLLVYGLFHGSLYSLPARAEPVWPSVLYLGVVASAGMLFLQAAGQRHVSAEKAAVIYAMEPVFAAVFGWWWLGEAMSLRGMVGGAMVVGAVILGEWRFERKAQDVPVD
jgi:drug/metabolite transporter (DMT)-like permease